jgi:hypothetical protein
VLDSIDIGNNDYPVLVFLQGVGKPMPKVPPIVQIELVPAAIQIDQLGGSGVAFIENPSAETGPGYSFVGASWPLPDGSKVRTQVTSSAPGSPPAQLDGYLSRDRSNRLVASVGNPAGDVQGADLEGAEALSSISAEINPADGYQPTPFPNDSNPQWQAALQFAAQVLNLPFDSTDACYLPAGQNAEGYRDIRALYCGGGDGCDYWTGLGQNLNDTPVTAEEAAQQGFTLPVWNAVLDQLTGEPDVKVGEFEMVDKLNCSVGSLQSVYGTSQGNALLDVGEIVDGVNQKLKLQPNRALAYSQAAEAIVGSFTEMIAAFFGFEEATEDLSTALWALASAMDLSEAIATTESGTQALT